ncbi:hypothetical protein HZS_873, partial [Henneguya salminicola]
MEHIRYRPNETILDIDLHAHSISSNLTSHGEVEYYRGSYDFKYLIHKNLFLFFSYNAQDDKKLVKFRYIGYNFYYLIDENNKTAYLDHPKWHKGVDIQLHHHKYYKIKLHDKYFSFVLKIHSEKHGNIYQNFPSPCRTDDKNIICKKSGDMICRDPNMNDPPRCVKKDALSKHLLCNNNGIIRVKRSMNNSLNLICLCFDEYFGKRCQHKNQCHNCQIEFCQKYKCNKCKLGWRGNNCQFNESVNYCRNGEKIGKTCKCTNGYTGNYCEIECIRIYLGLILFFIPEA